MTREEFLSIYHRVKNAESYESNMSFREDNQYLYAVLSGGASIYKTTLRDGFRNCDNMNYIDLLHSDVDDIVSYKDYILQSGTGCYELCHRKRVTFILDFYNNTVEREESDSSCSDIFIVLGNEIECVA